MNFGADQNFGMTGARPSGDDLSRQLGQRLQASELRTAETLSNMPYQSHAQQSSLEETLKSIVSHIEISDQRTAQAFQSIQQQMAHIANHPNMANSPYGSQNNATISNLENRLNSLVGQLEANMSQNAQANDRLEGQVSNMAQTYTQNPGAYDPETAHLNSLDGELQNLGFQQDQFGELAGRINENMTNGHDPHLSHLQNQVHDLHGQINVAGAYDPAIQDAISAQLNQISERLAETEARIHSIASLEANFQDLSQRMGTANNPTEISENKNALKALNQALGALRVQAQTSEEKTNETLEAVHDTLEKVISRIANLEQTPPEVIYRGTQPDSVISSLPEEFQHPNMSPPPSEPSINGGKGMGATAEIPPATAHEGRAGAVSNNFIQAARRAAQENVQGHKPKTEKSKKGNPAKAEGKSKRKPLLMAAAAVLIIIGGLQTYKLTKAGKINLPIIGKYINKGKTTATTELGKKTTPSATEISEPSVIITKSPDKPLPATDPVATSAPQSDPVPTQSTDQATHAPVTSLKKTAIKTVEAKSEARVSTEISPSALTKTSAHTKQNTSSTLKKTEGVQTSQSQNLTPLPPLGSGYKELPESIGSESLRRAAASGDPEAQFAIATHYLNGQGVKKNTSKAVIWYQRAAAKGLAPAQYRLGTFYEKGRGVKQDKMTARIWYERAAEQGNRKAMHNLAVIYADANNGKPDFTKAALWFRKASERDLTDSQFNMGILSERGLGVPKDPVEAYKWFAIAGSKGDKDSETRKNQLAKKMDPRSLVLAKLAVDNWSPRPVKKSANVVNIKKVNWSTASSVKSSKYAERQLIAEAQSRLNTLGYKAGPPDGIMGSRTRDAIKSYQKRMGLKVTGATSADLIKHLRSKTG